MTNQLTTIPVKHLLFGAWITSIIGFLGYSFYNPSFLDHEEMKITFEEYAQQLFLIYFLICMGRGVFLLPSSPFVVLGALLFPSQLWLIFFVSLLGIFASACVLYFFSGFFGFDTYFKKKYPEKIENIQEKVKSPKAFLFIVAWSAFPFVPTDLICYIAGTVKMPFSRMIAAMIIGEIPLVYFYVFYTNQALSWLG